MSSRTQASANPILTAFAQGLAQDRTSALAEFIAPTVVVNSTIGHFKKYDTKNMFQVLETARAVGGTARRVEFEASDPTYNCKPQALEITIDDAERDAAGDTDPILLEQAKTSVLVNTAVLAHENAVITAVKNAIAPVANRGNWSNNDVDPFDQIDEQIKAIADDCGFFPNRMVLGLGALYRLRQNAKAKARLSGVRVGGIGLNDIAACCLNPSIECRVGVLVKDTQKMPATRSTQNIVGDECFIFYGAAAPSTYDPSFAKTFRGSSGGVDSVRLYRDERSRSDVLAVDWSVDIQIISTLVARRLSIT